MSGSTRIEIKQQGLACVVFKSKVGNFEVIKVRY